jgi:glycosyltransferase involved in cell wall biosynthesis
VFDFVWIDNLAAARNAALTQATVEYAFWLHADDVIDPPERVKVRALLDDLRQGDDAGCVERYFGSGKWYGLRWPPRLRGLENV